MCHMVCLAAGVSAEAVLIGVGTAVKLESIKKAALKGAEQPRERSQPLVRPCPRFQSPGVSGCAVRVRARLRQCVRVLQHTLRKRERRRQFEQVMSSSCTST